MLNIAMRTVILFSSFFYLLGLKLGYTIDLLKKVAAPAKKVISAPAIKPEQAEKSYFFKGDGDSPKEQSGEQTKNHSKAPGVTREKITPVKPG